MVTSYSIGYGFKKKNFEKQVYLSAPNIARPYFTHSFFLVDIKYICDQVIPSRSPCNPRQESQRNRSQQERHSVTVEMPKAYARAH